MRAQQLASEEENEDKDGEVDEEKEEAGANDGCVFMYRMRVHVFSRRGAFSQAAPG